MYRPKHVEWTCREINSLHIVASVGHSIECILPFSNMVRYVHLNAHSNVMVNNHIYVDIVFFTQNDSNNIMKFGTPYAELPV